MYSINSRTYPAVGQTARRATMMSLIEVVELRYSANRGAHMEPEVLVEAFSTELPQDVSSLSKVSDRIAFRQSQGFIAEPNRSDAFFKPRSLPTNDSITFAVRPKVLNITLPDGTYTVVVSDKEEYTFKINTPTQGKMKGKRLISLYTGTNLATDYTSCWTTLGFVNPTDLRIWSRTFDFPESHKLRQCLPHAFSLVQMDHNLWLEATRQYALRSNRCSCCGHKLIKKDSILMSYGPVCAKALRKVRPEIFATNEVLVTV